MNRVLSNYKPGDELEVRFYLDPRCPRPSNFPVLKCNFKENVEKIISKLSNIHVTKIIDLYLGTYRKRITYVNDVRKEEFMEKKCIEHYIESNNFGGFRFAISNEIPTKENKLDRVDKIIVKYRMSSQDFDISAVKICSLKNIQHAKDTLLKCNNPLDNWHFWDHWEFEREYSSIENIDIYKNYEILAPYINYEMLDYVKQLAIKINHPDVHKFIKIDPKMTIVKLLPKAIEPTLETWIIDYSHMLTGMIIRDKIDGKRELIHVHDGKITVIDAKQLYKYEDENAIGEYVYDTEYADGCWYVLHPLIIDGKNVTHMNDIERLSLFNSQVFDIKICPYVIVKNKDDILNWWNKSTTYHRDGLIISTNEPYFQQKNIKWKPKEESTVDFLIVKCPEWLLGKHPYIKEQSDTLYLLNVGVNINKIKTTFPFKQYHSMLKQDGPYVPIPFEQASIWISDNPDLNGKIGEFIFNKGWELKRIREDKHSILFGGSEIGNDIKTATDIWSKIEYPFPIEYLWDPPQHKLSRFYAMKPFVECIISEINEEEKIDTVLTHMCPFNIKDALSIVSNNAPVEYVPRNKIIYNQIGKVNLPKEYIGGAHILITLDPEIIGHISCIAKLVKKYLVVLCRFLPGDNYHPQISRTMLLNSLEKAGFVLLNECNVNEEIFDMDSNFELYSCLTFRKGNFGNSNMTEKEIHKENPHLIDNPNANFNYKFSRQKTKELSNLVGIPSTCNSLKCDTILGELLVDIEYICNINETEIIYMGNNLDKLTKLFPNIEFHNNNNDKDIKCIISHCSYLESRFLIDKYKPLCGLLDFDHLDLIDNKIFKGKMILYPYSNLTSTKVALSYNKYRDEFNILSDIFHNEMMNFQKIYRPSCFKYKTRIEGLCNCYDCRSMAHIISKYANIKNIPIETAKLEILG